MKVINQLNTNFRGGGMGDHRASIKIEMEFHGVKDKTDMWINYSPNNCCDMDSRVIDFFNSVYKRGMAIYEKRQADYWAKQHKSEIEAAEKTELKRLEEKYKSRKDKNL